MADLLSLFMIQSNGIFSILFQTHSKYEYSLAKYNISPLFFLRGLISTVVGKKKSKLKFKLDQLIQIVIKYCNYLVCIFYF